MTSGALPSNPFVAAGMIEDSRLFVGRKDELNAIASRMKGDQPTSINIVGEKHIGKSSLLYYFVQTWQQRVLHNTNRYVVIYLPLRGVDCQTETGFYEAIAESLLSTFRDGNNAVCKIVGRVNRLIVKHFQMRLRNGNSKGSYPFSVWMILKAF